MSFRGKTPQIRIMGHVRLGTLPRTRAWKNVIELIADGGDAAEIASATVEAADKAFGVIQNDKGFIQTVELMKELAVAARSDNPAEHLEAIGIKLPEQPSVADVGIALSQAIDQTVASQGPQSDYNELARDALIGSVMEHLNNRYGTLIPASGDEITRALADLGKTREFGKLSRTFFGTLTNKSLEYFLSKTIGTQIGESQRFATTNQVALFKNALQTHCQEASEIVERFSEKWFSKNYYTEDGDISAKKTYGFGAYAMRKMRDELKMRAQDDES